MSSSYPSASQARWNGAAVQPASTTTPDQRLTSLTSSSQGNAAPLPPSFVAQGNNAQLSSTPRFGNVRTKAAAAAATGAGVSALDPSATPAPSTPVNAIEPSPAENATAVLPGLFDGWDAGMGWEHLNGNVGHPLGGVPTAHDFLPSLIFILLYAILLAPVILRLKTGMLTFGQLWRPLLVILLNIATYGVRIKLAEEHTWNKDTFIAEIVLLRLTPILLTSALVALFRHAVQPYLPHRDSPNLLITIMLRHFVAVLQIATYFCLGLTLAIAFDVKQAIDGSPEAHTKLHKSKEVCIYLLLVINASVWLLAAIPLVLLKSGRYTRELVVSHAREAAKFMAIIAVCTFLLVVASFKVAQLASAGQNNRTELITNEKSVFYSVCVTAEYIACALLVCLSWARLVPPRELLEMHCRLRRDAMQEREIHGHPSIGWPTPPGQLRPTTSQQDHSTFAASQEAKLAHKLTEPGHIIFASPPSARQHNIGDESAELDATPKAASGEAEKRPISDPFRIDSDDESAKNAAGQQQESSAASLSTISEVRESTPPPRFLQWARSLTRSPDRAEKRMQERQSGERLSAASPDASLEAMFARSGESCVTPVRRPSSSLAGSSDSVASRPALHLLQPSEFRRSGGSAVPGASPADGSPVGPSVPVRSRCQIPMMMPPLQRQPSSACSVRSHWSDDSEEERERSRGSISLRKKRSS